MQVLVRDNNVDQALKALKKKMQRALVPAPSAAVLAAAGAVPVRAGRADLSFSDLDR